MIWLYFALLVFLPSFSWAHNAPLDPYSCHTDSARFGNAVYRECHADLLAGQWFKSLNAEHVAYIAAQKALLATAATTQNAQQAIIADLNTKLSACTARCPTVSSASVSWAANADLDLAGYKVYHGTAPRTYQLPALLVPAGATATAVANLSAGTTYYFAVTAYDHAGNESVFSSEVVKAIP